MLNNHKKTHNVKHTPTKPTRHKYLYNVMVRAYKTLHFTNHYEKGLNLANSFVMVFKQD